MSETEKESSSVTEQSGTATGDAKVTIDRRSRFESSLAAFKYVTSLSRENEVKLRDSDRATTITLAIVCALTILSMILKTFVIQRLNLLLVCDILFGASLIFYLTNRFGILTTMPPRQALLTWQLMLCALLMGTFLTINLTTLIGLVVPNPSALNLR